MPNSQNLQMMLVEPEQLMRRTVAMTARSIGVGTIHEAVNVSTAERMLRQRAFHGAIIAIDFDGVPLTELSLLDKVRSGGTASAPDIPIAVMAERCDTALLQALLARDVVKIILKPFRARVLLDAFAEFAHNATEVASHAKR